MTVHPAFIRRSGGGLSSRAGVTQTSDIERNTVPENPSPATRSPPVDISTPMTTAAIIAKLTTSEGAVPYDWQPFKYWAVWTLPACGGTTRTKQVSLENGPEDPTTDTVTTDVLVNGIETVWNRQVPSNEALIITRAFVDLIPGYGAEDSATPALGLPWYGGTTTVTDARWLAGHLYGGNQIEIETIPSWLSAPDRPGDFMGGSPATNALDSGHPNMDPFMLRYPKLIKPKEPLSFTIEAGGDAAGGTGLTVASTDHGAGIIMGVEGLRVVNFNITPKDTEAELRRRIPNLAPDKGFQNLDYYIVYPATIATGITTIANFNTPANETWAIEEVGVFVPHANQALNTVGARYPPGAITSESVRGANSLYVSLKSSSTPIMQNIPAPNIPAVRNGHNYYRRDLGSAKLVPPQTPLVLTVQNNSGAAITRAIAATRAIPEAIGQGTTSSSLVNEGLGGWLFRIMGKKHVNFGT